MDRSSEAMPRSLLPAPLAVAAQGRGQLGVVLGPLAQPPVHVRHPGAEVEQARLADAIKDLQSSLDRLLDSSGLGVEGEHQDVLETYRMFANDRGWINRIKDAIKDGLTAEAAVQRVQVDNRVRMGRINDAYMRERLSDLDDLANRLISRAWSET